MNDNENKNIEEENDEEFTVYTLTDENGKEEDFELIASCEFEGNTYFALVPVGSDEDPEEEYVILKEVREDDEQTLVTIDDDEEFDRVADYFEDTVFGEIDYDEE